MNCPRCTGLMVRDDFLDLQDEADQCPFAAWRCLICGEVLDPVILKNRSAPPEPMGDRGRRDRGRHWPMVQSYQREHRARSSDPYRELGVDPGGVAPSAGVPVLSNFADRSLLELGDVSV